VETVATWSLLEAVYQGLRAGGMGVMRIVSPELLTRLR
jgi:hypothetical protein